MATNFISLPKNALYTEGRMIDLFMQNRIRLEPKRNSRIGLIAEPADQASLSLIDNIANMVEQTHGVEIIRILTSEKVDPNVTRTPSGAYVGTVGDPMTLLRAAKILVKEGAQALAITTNIRGYDEKDYREHFSGGHPNPIGGVEAIMSHFLTNETGFPAAHGPMINFKPSEMKEAVVDPRSAGEHVSQSGLASVLIGLTQAPRIIRNGGSGFGVESLTAVVVPATALGSIPVLEAHQRGIPVIAVRQNSSILNVTARALELSNVLEVESYLEAAAAIERLQRGEALSSLQDMNTKGLLYEEGINIADRLGLSRTILKEQGKNSRNTCIRSLLMQSEPSEKNDQSIF